MRAKSTAHEARGHEGVAGQPPQFSQQFDGRINNGSHDGSFQPYQVCPFGAAVAAGNRMQAAEPLTRLRQWVGITLVLGLYITGTFLMTYSCLARPRPHTSRESILWPYQTHCRSPLRSLSDSVGPPDSLNPRWRLHIQIRVRLTSRSGCFGTRVSGSRLGSKACCIY